MDKLIQNGELGNNLLRLREMSGLSQAGLVSKMQLLGSSMSRTTYSKIEAGHRNIKIQDLRILKEVLKVDYSEFFETNKGDI